jgi:hypothetical protein
VLHGTEKRLVSIVTRQRRDNRDEPVCTAACDGRLSVMSCWRSSLNLATGR